jgi:hypothetical protein
VRLRAPRGVGAVQLLSGARRNVPSDGTVEMSQSDAAPLLRVGLRRHRPLAAVLLSQREYDRPRPSRRLIFNASVIASASARLHTP